MTTILHILQHALGRDEYGKNPHGRPDYRNHYCAGGADLVACREAVSQGLMREHPPSEISGGDPVFTVTDKGKAHVDEHSPAPPRLTRGQDRYRRWLAGPADVMTFGEWLSRGGAP